MTTTKIKPNGIKALRAICVVLLLLTSMLVVAQSNSGKDFWMAQVANLSDKNDDIAIVVSNASANPASITITNPIRSNITAVIPAGGLQTFIVSSENPNIQASGTYTNNVWHIVSDQLVVVYNFQPYVNVISNDAAVLLPTHALGKKYFVGSYANSTGLPRNSFFSVTATLNGTNVNVYDNIGAFVESKFLNQGECYQRLNGPAVANDMTGWYIETDKPVALYSGNQCSNIGSGASCDLLVDQVLPLESLASTYIGSPSNTRPIAGTSKTPDLFRFVATMDNTIITFTPASVSAPVTLQKGQFVNITTGTPFVANANFPTYGYQFFLSQNSLVAGFVRPLTGDPSMMALPVVDQFLYNYNFVCAPTFPNNFVNVVAPDEIKLYIDNVLVSPTWTTAGTVNGVTYKSANIQVSAGRHTIAGDRKYGIVVYGFGDFASYGYLGGSGLEAINAGCITGGPYQVQRCSAPGQPVSVQLNGRPSCEDGSTPTIQWSSPDGVVFSNPNISNPIATAPGFGTYTVTMSVICGGNTIICSSDLEIREAFDGCANIPAPTLVPPPTVIVPSNSGQPYADNVTLGIATYNAEGSATLTNTALTQFPIGTTTVTWTVTDGYGRTASGNQSVIVVPPPTIVAPPAITVNNDAGLSYATVTLDDTATYVSYYGANVLTNDAPLNGQFSIGTTTVTWTVKDGFGRKASATQEITVVAPPPTIVAPNTITVTAGYDGFATVSNIGTPISHYVSVDPAVISNDNTLTQFPIGSTTITWTVTDGLNRTATDVQLIRVVAPVPVIAPPADIVISNDPGETYSTNVVLVDPVFTVAGTYTLTNDAPANGEFPLGNTTVTWTLTDSYGNTLTTTNTVTVTSAPPTIVAPHTIIVTAGYNGLANVSNIGTPISHYVSVDPAVISNDNTLTQFPIGSTTITWTVTDGLNRTATDVQLIRVVAPVPVIAPPADIVISNDPGETYSTNVVLVDPLFTVAGTYTLTNDAPANGEFPLGTTTVIWTLTDTYGNTLTTSNTVTVTSAPPTIVAPDDIIITADYSGNAIVNLGTATYTVSVDNASLASSMVSGSYAIGSYNITWTVTDGLGRTASDVQVVNVIAPLPMMTPPADKTVTAAPGATSAIVNIGTPVFSAVGPYTLINDAPATFPIGITIVKWTLTDAYGKVVTGEHTITVLRGECNFSSSITSVPTSSCSITGGIPTNLYIGYGPQSTKLKVNVPSTGGPFTYVWTGTGLNSTTSSYPTFTPTAAGNYTFTVTATNANGCTSTSTIKICVKDIRVLKNNGTWDGKKVYVCHLPPGNPGNVQTISISINAVDTHVPNHGGDQLGECNVVCDISDVPSAPPTIVAPDDITVTAGYDGNAIVNIGTATYTVSVNNASLASSMTSGSYAIGSYNITWTVTDGLGRTASDVQVVNVIAPLPQTCDFTSNITSVPTSVVNTGGNPNRLYLGYGAQSTKLQVSVPSTGGPYTFNWSGNGLSSLTSAAPIFTPDSDGIYTFSVVVKNASGCTSTSTISICVTDARVLDKKGKWDGKKVYVCHLPPGNPANVQIIHVSVNAVPTHVPNHGGDGLGADCSQTCSPFAKAHVPVLPVFAVSVTPNPSSGFFTLQVNSDDKYTNVSVRIMDAFGRTVQVMNNVAVEKAIRFGEKFASGAYYAEVIQGEERKVIQMMKAK